MRLLKYHKESFVRAVMADIPKVDYETEFQNLVREEAFKQLPKEIQAIAKDPVLASYLNQTYWHGQNSRCIGGVRIFNSVTRFIPDVETIAKFNTLHDKFEAQRDLRRETEHKLESAINSVNTVKQAREMFPELVKYLPEEEQGVTKNVPMVVNLVADLKSAGLKVGE